MYYYNLTMYNNDNCDPANENNFDKNSHEDEFDIMLEKTKKWIKDIIRLQ